MKEKPVGKVAILYPGDAEVRRQATPDNNRLATVFAALDALDIHAEPAVYHDDFCDEVRRQILEVDGVLVWMNPIQDGRDRSILDPMLREIAAAGITVSTHPDVILKMGTKEVLYRTRGMGWGCDTHLYRTHEKLREALPTQLAQGKTRVLKQYRGNGGNGVWRISTLEPGDPPGPDSMIRVRHARKGSIEETITLRTFFNRCERYFTDEGRMIDQEYQDRLPDGMVRCYLVQDRVAGFGHQAVNALFPAPPGAPASDAPQPGPRLYHPPTLPEFQALKTKLEQEWVPEMQRVLEIGFEELPMLWDCDFLLGPKTEAGDDTWVLCEINVSSVAPYPESAPPFIAKAVLARLQAVGKGSS